MRNEAIFLFPGIASTSKCKLNKSDPFENMKYHNGLQEVQFSFLGFLLSLTGNSECSDWCDVLGISS